MQAHVYKVWILLSRDTTAALIERGKPPTNDAQIPMQVLKVQGLLCQEEDLIEKVSHRQQNATPKQLVGSRNQIESWWCLAHFLHISELSELLELDRDRGCFLTLRLQLSQSHSKVIQGISQWSVTNKSALRGWRIHIFFELWCLVGSGGVDFCVSSTTFQKINIGWPQQPLTERVLKFNMIFPDSTPIFFPSKHQSKAEFKNLDDTEVLSSDFPGLVTSATSMTSMASTASVASMTSTASFHQTIYWK